MPTTILYAYQIIHFPIQPTLPLTFKISDNEVIFPSTSHPFLRYVNIELRMLSSFLSSFSKFSH